MSILSIFAKLGLDKSGFDAGMDAATKKASQFGGSLKSHIAGAFSVAAMAALTRETIEYGDSLEEVAVQLNITTKEAQQYAIASKLGGADISFFTDKWIKLQNSMRIAIAGGKNPFSSFGIGIEQLERMNASQVIRVLIDNLNDAGNSTQTTMAAFDMFGRGSGKMINILKDVDNAARGTLFFSDDMQARLQNADDIIVKAGNNAKVAWGWVLNKMMQPKNWFLSAINPALAMLPDDAAAKKKDRAADPVGVAENQEKEEANLDRILKLREQANDLNERTRQSQLTKEERINELLEERVEIERQLGLKLGDEADAVLALERAKIDSELSMINKAKDKGGGGAFKIHETAFGRIGAFTGAASQAAMPPGAREQLNALLEIHRTLSAKGIIVKDVR